MVRFCIYLLTCDTSVCEALHEEIGFITRPGSINSTISSPKPHFASMQSGLESKPSFASRAARMPFELTKIYLRLGKIEEAYRCLNKAAEAAIAFDNRKEVQNHSSLLLGDVEIMKIDFETADSRSLCEIMRDKWLASSEFDCIRDTPDFVDIINLLS